MKIRIVIAALVLMTLSVSAYVYSTVEAPLEFSMNTTTVRINNSAIDLGVLELNHPKSVKFIVENSGTEKLLINDVTTSCGCTTPVWTQKPVMPGSNAEVTVTYDAKYPGKFHKTISIFANVENSPIELPISGEVEFNEQKL